MNQESNVIYWDDIRSKLKQEYPRLTNADLQWRNSTNEDLLEMIAYKLGKTCKELQEIIDKL